MNKQKQRGIVRSFLASVACAGLLGIAPPAASTPIAVNFDEALSSTGLHRDLPFLVNATAQVLLLRFLVPDAPRILSINSMSVSVTLHDDPVDNQGQDEAADIALRLPAPFFGLFLDDTDAGALQGTTPGAPLVFNYALTPDEIDFFLLTGALDNGAFRLEVSRCPCIGGDFVVVGATVSIDANLLQVPEPGSLALLAAGFGVFALRRTRRKS